MSTINPGIPGPATATRNGLLSWVAQQIGGVKTFLAEAVFSAGIVSTGVRAIATALLLRSDLGAGSTDVGVIGGFSTADGTVHGNAKFASWGAGIGGTYVERAWMRKSGTDGYILGASAGTIVCNGSTGLSLNWSTVSIGVDGGSVTILESGTQGPIFKVLSTAEIKMKGLDRSATVGADTQNKPTGINTIANAATTCRITNSLVPDPATTKVRIHINWRGDHGAARSWVVQGNGFFDVTLSAGAGANTSFDWAVNGLL